MTESERKTTSELQKELMAAHYERAREASLRGIPVVYVTAMFPVEIVKAFEPACVAVYPENHAVSLIVKGLAERFAERAVGESAIDMMGCSYELANTGYLLELRESGGDPCAGAGVPQLPPPDVLLACNNQCDVVAEWYQNLSGIFGRRPHEGDQRRKQVRRRRRRPARGVHQETTARRHRPARGCHRHPAGHRPPPRCRQKVQRSGPAVEGVPRLRQAEDPHP